MVNKAESDSGIQKNVKDFLELNVASELIIL